MTTSRRPWFRARRLPLVLALAAGVSAGGCAARRAPDAERAADGGAAASGASGSPPAYVIGTFLDDYGGRHTITASEWIQGADDRYRIVRWNTPARYLIAENGSSGPTSLGRWTRIDWVPLDHLAPYGWAFCFSAFEAPTAAAAESSMVAQSDTPRTGCNGYPFTRMRAVPR